MTHYSNKPNDVRVDFFKESGKWYATEKMEWIGYRNEDGLVWAQFAKSLKALLTREGHGPGYLYAGLIAVCLEPYHENAFPLMARVDDIFAGKWD